ncbi:MAG TPA: hypothetical protein DCL32_04480 [Gammaproteobacteria bacterium]|nr:hypothetical protein [Gammaproteobacteria bacterium]
MLDFGRSKRPQWVLERSKTNALPVAQDPGLMIMPRLGQPMAGDWLGAWRLCGFRSIEPLKSARCLTPFNQYFGSQSRSPQKGPGR